MALPRLIFVTGKGGTGKSTAAASLALELARRKRVILADLAQRNGAAGILKTQAQRAAAKSLELVRLSPRCELELFVERIVPIKAVSRRMLSSRTFALVSAALPGLEAFLMLDRLRIMAGEAALHDHNVVVDAPATGSALELLRVARGTAALAPRGTLNRLAIEIEGFIRDPHRFAVAITLNPGPKPLFSPSEIEAAASVGGIHGSLALRRFETGQAATRARAQLAAAQVPVIELSTLFKRSIGSADLLQIGRTLAHGLENWGA
jgi:anion-transporting  ArsA/GET3 family ATPase